MFGVNIEFAKEDESSELLELVKELAVYEKSGSEVYTTALDYSNGLKSGLFKALVAKSSEGLILGMALYYPVFSTWNGFTMYLEDFIVKEQYRAFGIGKLLFERWIEESRLAGAKMLKWQVLDWNEPAKNFYRKYNTKFYPNWENGVIYLYR